MAASISVFGYSVPLTIVLVFVALVVGLALVVLFWLTIGWSVYRSVRSTRRENAREDLEDAFLDRVFDPDPTWEEWVESLSDTERAVAETLLDEYLRELSGEQVVALQDLGEALGIPERAQNRLESRGEFGHLYALTWLTLLDEPERARAANFEPETPRERAAVARLRYESDDFDDPEEGIALLLDGARTQFSVFGQDTLYRIAMDDPGVLFAVGSENYQTWSDPLLVQVLVVCQHLGQTVRTEDLSWLTATLEHENEAVREAATLALGNVGWRSDIRDAAFLRRLTSDDSPRVRAAVYRTLARWGDDEALETLTGALQHEADARTRLVGTDALARRRDQFPAERGERLDTAWRWSRENVDFDRIARRQERAVSD